MLSEGQMALPNQYTKVTVFAAEYVDDIHGSPNQRVLHPPQWLADFEMPSGGLQLGRSTQESGLKLPGYQHFDFAPNDGLVSRSGFNISEEAAKTIVQIEQDCVMQQWGRSSSGKKISLSKRAAVTEPIDNIPTSFRIDGELGCYWILIEPGMRPEPPPRPPVSEGRARVTLTKERLKPETEMHDDFLDLLPVIEVYFGQLLEWPPRVQPARDLWLEYTEEKDGSLRPPITDKNIRELKKFEEALGGLRGYNKWDSSAVSFGMLEWMTEPGGNIPFHNHWQESRIGATLIRRNKEDRDKAKSAAEEIERQQSPKPRKRRNPKGTVSQSD